jgi:hypothetical protein
VEVGSTQSLGFTPLVASPTTITNWIVNSDLGDYVEGAGLNLITGVYTIPATGLYHILASISVNYTPTNGALAYNTLQTPMSLQFYLYGSTTTSLLSASFFSNAYAGLGGNMNLTDLDTYVGATLAGDLSLTAGNQYALQVINPFVNTTPVVILSGGSPVSGGAYSRWSMRQFA